MQPLAGIRVLDLSRVVAGPWSTQLLADLGAEVIKVERPGKGDDTRSYPPFLAGAEGDLSAFFLSSNRGKKSVAVDIASSAGREIIRRLASRSDVLVENFKVGDLARYGLDYEALSDENPRLIYCSITGFGQTGPYGALPGYDAVIQAMSGLMSVTGHADGSPGAGPMRIRVPIIDMWGGMNAATAILGALYERDARQGAGQYIDMSLLDCGIALVSYPMMLHSLTGQVPQREGDRAGSGGPIGTYPCSDGAVVLTCGNDRQFAAFCRAVGREDLANDPSFQTIAMRTANRARMDKIVEAITRTYTRAKLTGILNAAGVPAGPINTMVDVLTDSHVQQRQIMVSGERSDGTSVPLIRNPIRYSRSASTSKAAPPSLGEHTHEILRDVLGMQDGEIRELEIDGII